MTGEQLFTDQLLQTLHLLADGRLRTAYRCCCCGKRIQIGDCDKRSQQIEVEV